MESRESFAFFHKFLRDDLCTARRTSLIICMANNRAESKEVDESRFDEQKRQKGVEGRQYAGACKSVVELWRARRGRSRRGLQGMF